MNRFKLRDIHKLFLLLCILLSIISPVHSTDFPTRRTKKILTIKDPKKPFRGAYDIAIDLNTDTIYVPNNKTRKIQAYDTDGKFIFEFGESKEENVVLKDIRGLWVDPSGKIFVVSQGNNKVFIYDSQGNFLLKIDIPANGWDVVTNSFGDIFVSINKFAEGGLVIYDSEGKYKFTIKKIVLETGEKYNFGDPVWLGVTSNDHVFLTDGFSQIIYIFDVKGRILHKFGGTGDVVGKFFAVAGIAVDYKNRVYIMDKSRGFIHIFTNSGDFISSVANEKGGPPEISIANAIAFDSKQRLYCLDPVMSSIAVLEFIDK